MVALAMLSTSRLALDETTLRKVLNTYKALLTRVPYSPSMTLPDMDGQAMINYVEGMQFMGRQSDALGEILFLDEPQAVLMTYYRNNVLHLIALPALIACLFLNNPRMSREQIEKLISAVYPYLQGELFLQWQEAALPAVINTWIDGLITSCARTPVPANSYS